MNPIFARIICLLIVIAIVYVGAAFWMHPAPQVIFGILFGILGLGLSEHIFRFLTKGHEGNTTKSLDCEDDIEE